MPYTTSLNSYIFKTVILRFAHANDLQMDRHPRNDFPFLYMTRYITASGTYAQFPDELGAKMADLFIYLI